MIEVTDRFTHTHTKEDNQTEIIGLPPVVFSLIFLELPSIRFCLFQGTDLPILSFVSPPVSLRERIIIFILSPFAVFNRVPKTKKKSHS